MRNLICLYHEKRVGAPELSGAFCMKGRNTMFEKVNPAHPDKQADRIAGAIVDIAYKQEADPRIAVEVLLGHGICHIIAETDIRCGDNGIFRGVPLKPEQQYLTAIAEELYNEYGCDGKYIMDGKRLIICQSGAATEKLRIWYPKAEINPLGDWTGGTDVDTGATNRKLGSDMADSVTGGGLHGKDLSKADVSVNIWAWLKAQETGKPVEVCCAIGDDHIGDVPFGEIVETARDYIQRIGGFEKFAEWGLVR